MDLDDRVVAFLQRTMGDLTPTQRISFPSPSGMGFGFHQLGTERVFHHTVSFLFFTLAFSGTMMRMAIGRLRPALPWRRLLRSSVSLQTWSLAQRRPIYSSMARSKPLPNCDYYMGVAADACAAAPDFNPPHCPALGAVAQAKRLQN
eukprot:3628732-Amphidinium_carterae.1